MSAMKATAEMHLKEAQKEKKTSLFKSGDLESAGFSYNKAGKAFKMAKMYPEALKAFKKGRDCYFESGALSHAARDDKIRQI
jgi:hypothetical protein